MPQFEFSGAKLFVSYRFLGGALESWILDPLAPKNIQSCIILKNRLEIKEFWARIISPSLPTKFMINKGS
jgi:hypothetical protein